MNLRWFRSTNQDHEKEGYSSDILLDRELQIEDTIPENHMQQTDHHKNESSSSLLKVIHDTSFNDQKSTTLDEGILEENQDYN